MKNQAIFSYQLNRFNILIKSMDKYYDLYNIIEEIFHVKMQEE